MEDNNLNSEILLYDIELIVKMYRVNYIDALVLYCEKKNYDVEIIAKIIPPSLKSKIEESAKELKLLKREYNVAQALPL